MSSHTTKLYHSLPSPNSRRVRMFLAEKGLSIQSVSVDLGTVSSIQKTISPSIRVELFPP
jgi:glutathione S-transferase